MGSWRLVIVVAAIAAGLWGAVILGVGASETDGDAIERLAGGARAADVVALELVAGEDSIRLTRTDAGFVDGDGRPANPEVLDTWLGALEYTFSRRRGVSIDSARRTLVARLASGQQLELRLGDVVGDGALVWVGTGDGARLVTATEAAQLFPAPSSLRDNRVFRDATGGVTSVEVDLGDRRWRIGGDPLSLEDGGSRWRVDRARLASLLSELESVVLVAGEATAVTTGVSVSIESRRGAARLAVVGACKDGVAVSTQLGDGCVATATIERIAALVGGERPFTASGVIDPNRRPVRAQVTIGSDVIEVDPGADGGAAASGWIASLARASGELAPAATLGPPRARVVLTYDRGEAETVELGSDGSGVWARLEGERVAWRLESSGLLDISSVSFRSLRLVDRDRFEMRRLAIRTPGDNKEYLRSDDGAWLPVPPDGIAPALAHLAAKRFISGGPKPEHGLSQPVAIIEVDFDPPPVRTAGKNRFVLRLGSAIGDGCYAQLEGDAAIFIAEAPICALAAP